MVFEGVVCQWRERSYPDRVRPVRLRLSLLMSASRRVRSVGCLYAASHDVTLNSSLQPSISGTFSRSKRLQRSRALRLGYRATIARRLATSGAGLDWGELDDLISEALEVALEEIAVGLWSEWGGRE